MKKLNFFPNYYYKIITRDKKIKEGYMHAPFKFFARKVLSREGSIVVVLSSDRSSSFFNGDLPFLSGFSLGEKIYFFRNLAMMFDSGISVIESLEIISDQVKSNKAKKAILEIAKDIRNGRRLSEAMRKFPKYFPGYIVENVNMGDTAGRLTETLDRISTDLEKDDELRKKVAGAIAYPAIIIIVMIIVVITLIFFVLPGISQIFVDLEVPVPLPTKILLGAGEFVRAKPFLVPVALLAFFIFIALGLKFKKTRYFLHYIAIRLPIFGELLKDYNLVLFFRSLESLFKSGVPIVSAVEIARKTTSNEVYKKALDRVSPALLHGVSFSDAIASSSFLFSQQTRKIIMVGEKSGKINESFNRLTAYYLRSVDYKTRMLTILIEPILMLFLGLIVGALALSIFLPIYGAVNTIG